MTQLADSSTKDLLEQAVSALRESEHRKAITIAGAIIEREPNHPSAHAILFSSLFKSDKLERARQIGGKAAELNPESLFILNNQACLQLEAKQPAAAAGLLKSLIDQFGERGQWLYNLALAQRMVGNYDYSISMFQRTLDHKPSHDRAAFQLADCLRVVGRHEESVEAYEYVRLLRSKHAPSHSNFIHQAAINGSLSRHDLKQEFRLWEDRFIPKDNRYLGKDLSGNTQFKIGFLIGVLPLSWLNSMVMPLINQLAQGDDVIVDVCGMRVGTRQRTLGLQLASIQLGWLAHEGLYATPLVTILDKRLGIKSFFVNEPTAKKKGVGEKVLLGIGCHLGLSHEVIKTWAELLKQLPDWTLHLDVAEHSITKTLLQRFEAQGIDKKRLDFNARLGARTGTIVLDNFTENDPVSAANALAQGGILVCLKGSIFPAKQNANLLRQFGRLDWVCSNRARYMQRVIELANGAPAEPVSPQELRDSKLRNLGAFVMAFRKAILRRVKRAENVVEQFDKEDSEQSEPQQ